MKEKIEYKTQITLVQNQFGKKNFLLFFSCNFIISKIHAKESFTKKINYDYFL
jgi:hypothetical protein